MSTKPKIPKKLFKYRAFNNQILEMLIADRIFYADPSTFNDPLDTKPTLETDLEVEALTSILTTLVEQRISEEMSAAAKSLKYKGPKTVAHIAEKSNYNAQQVVADIKYNATNSDYENSSAAEKFLFGGVIEQELLRRYHKGIFSLAEKETCPLMWSHYADQHKGLCIGYSVPETARENLYKITYGGSRLIQTSRVRALLAGDVAAQQEVDQAILARKAPDWRYEKEWRLVGSRGMADSPLELEEIVFGMRCSSAVKYAVIKSLEQRRRRIKFYEINERHDSFLLQKSLMDIDEMMYPYPRRSLDIYDDFEDLTIND